MAEVPSTFNLKVGVAAPDFQLSDGSGKSHALTDLKGEKGTLVIFCCNHCPFVVMLAQKIGDIARSYKKKGISTVAISANDVEHYPQDAPEKMTAFAKKYAWGFPYLYDATQAVAKAYGAACTPDFFLFDKKGKLFYAGQFDDARPGNGVPVTGQDLKQAMDFLLEEKAPVSDARPSTGCNIKWKSGNEPAYFAR